MVLYADENRGLFPARSDVSVRPVKRGQLLYALNLWIVTDRWRTNRVLSN